MFGEASVAVVDLDVVLLFAVATSGPSIARFFGAIVTERSDDSSHPLQTIYAREECAAKLLCVLLLCS